MQQQEALQSISKYFSRFTEQIKILNKNGEFSINIHAENVLIKILNIIFDSNFENVNYSESKNYDSIDLRDEKKFISVQITATSNIKKIKDTLKTYVHNKHFNKFKHLKILILTGRQERYSQEAIDNIVNSTFEFNTGKDIIDFASLYVLLNKQNELTKILSVKELLEAQFSDLKSEKETLKISKFKELCISILPYLEQNERYFTKYGPNSGSNAIGPIRWDLTMWYKVRREKILPNNNFIYSVIEQNLALVTTEYLHIFENLLTHIYAFEKHCEDSNFDYSQYVFPKSINQIVENESK